MAFLRRLTALKMQLIDNLFTVLVKNRTELKTCIIPNMDCVLRIYSFTPPKSALRRITVACHVYLGRSSYFNEETTIEMLAETPEHGAQLVATFAKMSGQ